MYYHLIVKLRFICYVTLPRTYHISLFATIKVRNLKKSTQNLNEKQLG